MIIGNALANLVDGMTLDVDGKTINIKNSFDDQEALDKFIKELNKRSLKKFPLIFFVTSKTTDKGENMYSSNRQIVIMTNTNPNWLSKDRTSKTYTKVIHPIYKQLIELIETSKSFKILGDRKTNKEFTDRSNYGIVDGRISKTKSKKSVVTDYVDARIIELEIEYSENQC